MAGILYSARGVDAKAACGHTVSVYVPASGGRPGPVGQRNIAAAQAHSCYDCQVASGVKNPRDYRHGLPAQTGSTQQGRSGSHKAVSTENYKGYTFTLERDVRPGSATIIAVDVHDASGKKFASVSASERKHGRMGSMEELTADMKEQVDMQVAHDEARKSGIYAGDTSEQLKAKVKEARAEIKGLRQWGGRHKDRAIGRLRNKIVDMQEQIKANTEAAKAAKRAPSKDTVMPSKPAPRPGTDAYYEDKGWEYTAAYKQHLKTIRRLEHDTQALSSYLKGTTGIQQWQPPGRNNTVRSAVKEALASPPMRAGQQGLTHSQIWAHVKSLLRTPASNTEIDVALEELARDGTVQAPSNKSQSLVHQFYTLKRDAPPEKTFALPAGSPSYISTKEAAAATGYDSASLVRMARTGKIDGAVKDASGSWLLPSEKLPKRGQRAQRGKSARSDTAQPSAPASKAPAALHSALAQVPRSAGTLTWEPIPGYTGEMVGSLAMLGLQATDGDMQYNVIGSRWGDKPWEWEGTVYRVQDGHRKRVDESASRTMSSRQTVHGRSSVWTGSKYKTPMAAMKWAEKKAVQHRNVRDSMRRLQPVPAPANSTPRASTSEAPLTQESINIPRR